MNMCYIDPTDPTQWKKDCAYGICPDCPVMSVDVPTEMRGTIITYSQWTYGVDDAKKKRELFEYR